MGDEYKKDLFDVIMATGEKVSKGFTRRLSSKDVISKINTVISTSAPNLDRILACTPDGLYGMPVSRIIGINGKEASGKTTIILMIMKEILRMGGVVRLYETEMAFDPIYATACGVDIDEVLISQPDFFEQMLDSIKDDILAFKNIREEYEADHDTPWPVPMLIAVDSIAGCPPKVEYELGTFEDNQARALHARILSKFFRWATKRVAKENICLIMTNQTKVDTNVTYGSKDTAIGGRALRFHASIMLELKKSGWIKPTKDGKPVGIYTDIKTTKNKVLPPFETATVPIMWGKGIDYERSIFDLLKSRKFIKQAGASYRLEVGKKTIKAQGQVKFLEQLSVYTNKKKWRKKLERMALQ